jgi:hypothetical protein
LTILLTGPIAVRGPSPFNRIGFCMKKNLLAVAVLCALTSGAAFAQQAESPWLVRVRAVHLDSANKDSTGLGLSVNNKTIPEVDISYFFNKNVAAELILTVPQKHDLRSNGWPTSAALKHLPPSLLLQYHFDAPGFKPYVGAGVNYTRFSSVRFDPPWLCSEPQHRQEQLGRCPAGRRGHSAVQEPVSELRREEGLHQDRRVRWRRQGRARSRWTPCWWAWASAGASDATALRERRLAIRLQGQKGWRVRRPFFLVVSTGGP